MINEEYIKEFKKFREEIDKLEDELGKEFIETMKKCAFSTKEEDFSSYYQKKEKYIPAPPDFKYNKRMRGRKNGI